jgi:hypothetical protein
MFSSVSFAKIWVIIEFNQFFYSKFHYIHFLSYTCFFTPKQNSPCFAFQHDSANFKGPDGVLLCYKTQLFDEIQRYHYQQLDVTRGKAVSENIY